MEIGYVSPNDAKRLTELINALLKLIKFYENYQLSTLVVALNGQDEANIKADDKRCQRDVERYNEVKRAYSFLREDKVNIMDIDFKALKRKSLPLILPDRFLVPSIHKLGIQENEVETIFQNLSGTLDYAIDIKKRVEESGYKICLWVHPRPNTIPNTFNSSQNSQDDAQSYTEYFDDESVFDTLTEYFKFLFQKVPRNALDYAKIKKAYQRTINNINEKVARKSLVIRDIERNLADNWRKYEASKQPQSLQAAFEKEMADLNTLFLQLGDEINKLSKELGRKAASVDTSSTQFKTLYSQKMADLNAKAALLDALSKMSARDLKKKYRGTRFTNAEMRDNLSAELNEFPDYQSLWNWAINQMLERNRGNKKTINRMAELRHEQTDIQTKLKLYHQNPQSLIDLIISRIEADYGKTFRDLNRRRGQVMSKRTKREASLKKVQEAYDKFLEQYQAIYEPRNRGTR